MGEKLEELIRVNEQDIKLEYIIQLSKGVDVEPYELLFEYAALYREVGMRVNFFYDIGRNCYTLIPENKEVGFKYEKN